MGAGARPPGGAGGSGPGRGPAARRARLAAPTRGGNSVTPRCPIGSRLHLRHAEASPSPLIPASQAHCTSTGGAVTCPTLSDLQVRIGRPQASDLGVAREKPKVWSERYSEIHCEMGTPGMMPPESIQTLFNLDHLRHARQLPDKCSRGGRRTNTGNMLARRLSARRAAGQKLGKYRNKCWAIRDASIYRVMLGRWPPTSADVGNTFANIIHNYPKSGGCWPTRAMVQNSTREDVWSMIRAVAANFAENPSSHS